MSRKPATKKKNDNAEFEFIGYVNITLTDAEVAEVDAVLAKTSPALFEEHVESILQVGKLSLNYVKGDLNATLTVMEGVSMGYAVSAYGADMHEAVAFLRFKMERYLDKFKEIYEGGGSKRRRG